MRIKRKNRQWVPKCTTFTKKATVLRFWMNERLFLWDLQVVCNYWRVCAPNSYRTRCPQRRVLTSAVRKYDRKPNLTSQFSSHELKLILQRLNHVHYSRFKSYQHAHEVLFTFYHFFFPSLYPFGGSHGTWAVSGMRITYREQAVCTIVSDRYTYIEKFTCLRSLEAY